jgi:phosphopantothenoylcysteine decarboxylase/phosphopantothenate--cysteine ligase
MRILVTCGPTYEPLDQVRRLTNFSTGQLGTELGNFLVDQGHFVTLLKGCCSTSQEPSRANSVLPFTTTENLRQRIAEVARSGIEAVFHAAAVSDFRFGQVFRQTPGGLQPIQSGKFSTREGSLLAELVPTPKLLAEFRALFPSATIVGWKYEVDHSREEAIALGIKQLADNQTDYCVLNGPAYGDGFGILSKTRKLVHCPNRAALFALVNDIKSFLA